jgi:hypothetical protein
MSGRTLMVILAAVLLILAIRLYAASGVETLRLAPASPPLRDTRFHSDAAAAVTLPMAHSRAELEPPVRDPFATPRAIAPAIALAASPMPMPMPMPMPSPAISPTPPAAPEPGLTFAGRMVTPDGATLVLASLGNDTFTLRTGQQLANGYRVDAIDAESVLLSHPALNQPARLAIPPAPRLQTR